MPAIVAAMSQNRVIGHQGGLPWKKIKSDMDFFHEITAGGAIIMGRATYLSIPEHRRPLPNRLNIVLSRQSEEIPGATLAHSLDEAFAIAAAAELPVFVIGGGKVFADALPEIDTIYLTTVDADLPGDTYFPELDLQTWEETKTVSFPQNEQNEYSGTIHTYVRRTS